jgi:hypothetical protein
VQPEFSIEDLLYEEESTTLDFKREQYRFTNATDYEKSELLKDILAFSNSWRRIDAYILIGVAEVKGAKSEVIGITEELDDSRIQQFVNSKTNRAVIFEYKTVLVEGRKIGLIRIPVQERPLYLVKDFGNLRHNVVYLRRGSSTAEATPDEQFRMARSDISQAQEIPSLNLEFANPVENLNEGGEINRQLKFLEIPDLKKIPDYHEKRGASWPTSEFMSFYDLTSINRDFYRDMIEYYHLKLKSFEVGFCLKNDSSKVVNDVRVEITIETPSNELIFFKKNKLPDFPRPRNELPHAALAAQINNVRKVPLTSIKRIEKGYLIELLFGKIQPRQVIFLPETIYVGANKRCIGELNARIFGDNIAAPIETKLLLRCEVETCDGSLETVENIYHDEMMISLEKK